MESDVIANVQTGGASFGGFWGSAWELMVQ
jgi:hypothetical protein